MLASILIIGFSLILLVYWFRYSCILLLRNFTEQPVSSRTGDNRFGFPEVQHRLKTGCDLDPLWTSLDRDYRMISYLLAHAPGLGLQNFEDRLLVWDYQVMQFWYRFTRLVAPVQARKALTEMASILSVLAQKIGEHAGLRGEA